jgi:hypothetical protein
MTNSLKIKFTYFVVFLYAPFLLATHVPASFRVSFFVLVILLLLSATKRFQSKDMLVCVILAFVASSFLAVNINNIASLMTAGNVMLTLTFAYALSRAAQENHNLRECLVRGYIILSIIVPFFSLLSIIFLMVFGELNIFNLRSGDGGYPYFYTPFGLILDKNYFGLNVHRSFFYFDEPIYPGAIYAANIFLMTPYLTGKRRLFLIANVVGGILTYSVTFLALSVLFFALKKATISVRTLRISFAIVLISTLLVGDFLLTSSLDERLYRVTIFFNAIDGVSLSQLMFGLGFDYSAFDFNKGFSMGLLTAIWELGVVNLILIIFLSIILANRRMIVFVFFFVTALVFEPFKMPIFWVVLVVLSVILPASHGRAPGVRQGGCRIGHAG